MTSSSARIGRFLICAPLGQGGMGTLYLAWDPELERQVAIKVLNRDDEELRMRFIREARSAARLRHPHIVTIFDVGEHDEKPFIAMEYIPGVTLAGVIADQQRLATNHKLDLMAQLCDGLAFAHRKGIVHRDVKPTNLMISEEGALKILDFGVARIIQAAGLTQAGSLVGTLNYMSPEQVAGEVVDHRSDIFAVGVVLYEVLSYRQAFPGGLADGVLSRILNGQPEPLEGQVPEIDPRLIGIVDRAMEKDPVRRYPELDAMAEDLRRVRSRMVANAEAATVSVDVSGPGTATSELESLVLSPPSRLAVGSVPAAGIVGSRFGTLPWLVVAAAVVLLVGLVAFWLLLKTRATVTVWPAAVEGEERSEDQPEVPDSPFEGVTAAPIAKRVPAAIPPAEDSADVPEETVRVERIGATRTTVLPECAQLLERASLGERLTDNEWSFLRRRCGR